MKSRTSSMPQQPDDARPLPGDHIVKLPVHCATMTAEELRVQFVLACDRDGGIEIDASEVESVGQAVLQLLVAVRAEAIAGGLHFAISNPSPAFAARATACHLGEAIGLTVEEEPVQ